MVRAVVFTVLVVLAALAGCGKKTEPTTAPPADGTPAGAPVADKERFQGVWKLTSADKGDGPQPPLPARTAVMVFKGDRLTYHESAADTGDALAVVADATREPKRLTVTPLDRDGNPLKVPAEVWLYRFDGDALEVAFAREGATVPTEFKARRPPGGVFVLRFAKSNEPPPDPPRPLGTRR